MIHITSVPPSTAFVSKRTVDLDFQGFKNVKSESTDWFSTSEVICIFPSPVLGPDHS